MSVVEYCSMFWHGPGAKLELTPMTAESTSGVYLEQVNAKLNQLAKQGWHLKSVTATRGQWLYILARTKGEAGGNYL